jgi:hypothetical protein
MRIVIALILSLFVAPLHAAPDDSRADAGRRPTATDVISGLYTFSRFQHALLESADLKGNAEVRTKAAARAEEATQRDQALKEIQQAIGIEPRVARTPAATDVAEPDSADGPAFIRSFYAAQVPEYESVILLLERYLAAPDNPALATFARSNLPILREQMTEAGRVMSDK